MFFIAGSYDSVKQRGVVADHCPICGALTTLRMTQHYRTSHLYFVPLGRGSLTATVQTCVDCGGKTNRSMDAYGQPVGEMVAKSMHLGEILQQTNPRLAQAIANRAQLVEDARNGVRRTANDPDPQVKLALAKLADLDPTDPKVADAKASLSRWEQFDSASRAILLRDVDALMDRLDRRRTAGYFLRQMAEQSKVESDGFVRFAAFSLVAGFGAIVTLLTLFPTNLGLLLGFLASVGLGVAAASMVQRRYERWVRRRFFRKVIIAEAAKRELDIYDVLDVLRQIDPNDQTVDGRLRVLAKESYLLEQLIETYGDYAREFD